MVQLLKKRGLRYFTFGLKTESGRVVLEPTYKYYDFKENIYVFSNIKEGNKFIDAIVFNENGKELGRFEEFYPFIEDGLAIVKSRYNNFFGRFYFFTKKGGTLGIPFKSLEEAKIGVGIHLVEAIELIGANAIKYATKEILLDESQMPQYKEALKKYIFSTGVVYMDDKTEDELKSIVKKEYDLFNSLLEVKTKTISEDKETKRNNIINYIDELIK